MKYFSFLIILFSISLPAQNTSVFFDGADAFFNKYVENGKVKYTEIKDNPKHLKELLAEAKKVKVSPDQPKEFKAFWINAYNLAVINGIVQNYPVKSPMDIEGFFDKKLHSLGQRSVTLDEIEKKILFKNFPSESRFHFVLVCAAKSCPPIIDEAYLPKKLEAQLQEQTKHALNDPEFLRVENQKAYFSNIFNWYKKDFLLNSPGIIEYVNQYRNKPISASAKIDFYEYNWELNDFK